MITVINLASQKRLALINNEKELSKNAFAQNSKSFIELIKEQIPQHKSLKYFVKKKFRSKN